MKISDKKIVLVMFIIGFILMLTTVNAEKTVDSSDTILNSTNDQPSNASFFNTTSDNDTVDIDNNSSDNDSYNVTYPIQEPKHEEDPVKTNNIDMENTGLPLAILFIILVLPGIIHKIKK